MFIDFGRMSARMNRLDRKLINYKILIALLGNTNGCRKKISS